ncbi:MAG: nitronate monooxygenase [Thermodesulfobacteriota bacterium]
MTLPSIIQGGMGAGVSNWLLADAVAKTGQLGVVSGTALDVIFSRRLQIGDPGGHMLRAIERFPVPEVAERVLKTHFVPGGKAEGKPFKAHTSFSVDPPAGLVELTVLANFVEVLLAKEGHDGLIGINFLEKIQMPNLASLYGAMLAGVDYVLMGAGIPREIPGILDKLSGHEEVSMSLDVSGATGDDSFRMHFDPRGFTGRELPGLKRPLFLAIIASSTLARTLVKKSTGKVDGFVIEGPSAGGHNALPRGPLTLNGGGQPVYGPKDEVDLETIKALGLPFWLAGSFGTPEKLKEALSLGASGIQMGTVFALCRESGLTEEIKSELIEKTVAGEVCVFTDPKASPTGFPFKVAKLAGSNSEKEVYSERRRVCDIGYLRHLYKKEDGSIGYRCQAEPVEVYVKKGGKAEDTEGRKCLCNGLLSNIGLPQSWKDGYEEKPLVTMGDDIKNVTRFLKNGAASYSAEDVVKYMLGT